MAKNMLCRFLLCTLLACVFIVGLVGSASALSRSSASGWAAQNPVRHCVAYKNVKHNGKTVKTCVKWAK